MKIPKKFKYVLIFFCIALLLGPYLLYKGLYWHGLRYLPEHCQPIRDDSLPEHRLPEHLLELTWREFGGIGPRRMVPIRFDHFIRLFIDIQRGKRQPILTSSAPASFWAALILLQDLPRMKSMERLTVQASTAVWLSHHWLIDEMLSTILHTAYYGNGMHGITQAAQGYFAKVPSHLSLEESAVLLVIIQHPSHFNPWNNPDTNLKFANRLLQKISGQAPMMKLPDTLVPLQNVDESS